MSEEEKALREYLKSDEYEGYIKRLKKIPVKPIENPYDTLSSKDKPKLKTNTVLDELFGVDGGITSGKLIELYGGYGSGKSQTVYTLIAEATQEGTVILIDSEYTWSPERQTQICETRKLNVEKKNFILIQPANWEQQLAKILTLPSKMDLDKEGRPPLKLIAVDSLVKMLDDDRSFRGRQNLPLRAGIIRDMLRALREASREHQCVVVFTNQISAVPDIKPFTPFYLKEQGTGGNVTRHAPDIVIYLRRAKDPIRVARLMDSSELPVGERVFQINEKGIDDVDDKVKDRYKGKFSKEVEEESE